VRRCESSLGSSDRISQFSIDHSCVLRPHSAVGLRCSHYAFFIEGQYTLAVLGPWLGLPLDFTEEHRCEMNTTASPPTPKACCPVALSGANPWPARWLLPDGMTELASSPLLWVVPVFGPITCRRSVVSRLRFGRRFVSSRICCASYTLPQTPQGVQGSQLTTQVIRTPSAQAKSCPTVDHGQEHRKPRHRSVVDHVEVAVRS
jgi:hypothetical protein